MKSLYRLAAAATLAGCAAASDSVGDWQTPAQILASAPDSEWRAIADEDLLVMTMADGSRIDIQLAPRFAPQHIANVRRLAKIGWWDGATIDRVQDNFVVQWGGATIRKPKPDQLPMNPAPEFELRVARKEVRTFDRLRDAYGRQAGFLDGWSVTYRGAAAALAHCYGTVGAGRDFPPDTGWGSELYAVIGHAPRQLDRNMALIGRVVGGVTVLSGLPRGRDAAGVYASDQPRPKILTVRLSSAMPLVDRPRYRYLDPGSPSFARYLSARAERRDRFYVTSVGTIDLCSMPVPIEARPLEVRRIVDNG